MATAPSVRTVAAVFGLLLLAFALSSTVIYLASPARAASPGSILLNLRPFAARCPPAPLRVFMYDLPPRFHVAMMAASRNGGFGAEGDSTAFPAWPPSAGGIRRQHSVEYWMMASLQQQQGGAAAAAEAVRVRDPAAAEAFFVPFFSSLSFNVHGRNMTDPDTEADRLLQEGKSVENFIKILKDKDGVRFEDTADRVPFEDEIDYSEFSLFFSVEEALEPDYLLNQLRQMPKE
ncbi:hypothetical protein ZWY2020_059787, partial [Hordeum vulgare]